MALPGTQEAPAAGLPRPLLEAARRRAPEAEAQLRDAWSRFGPALAEAAARHGLDTALILAELGLDADTLAAGLLLPAVEAEELLPESISEEFSPHRRGPGERRAAHGQPRRVSLRRECGASGRT